ncbi:MAG: EAL domain-containing protein [Clostridia bacterium]|nr:EAL domain-containing protein [Clostridia bacterium]
MRKRIAVLAAQIEEKTPSAFLRAFTDEAYKYDYDVCIFASIQKFQLTEPRIVNDSSVFSLIQYDSFDGIVILLDTIQNPGMGDKIQNQIKNEYDGPVLVFDHESSFFETIMINHYEPMKKLVDHVIEAHGVTDIAFLGGKPGHSHSLQRLNGFLDSMRNHDIPVRSDWVFDGNYWYDSGNRTAQKLMEHPEDMPKAVVCANDYMAVGVATTLTECGYRVPEDIAIIGYDSSDVGRLSPKPITSAEIPAGKCGRLALRRIHEMITDEKLPEMEMDTEIFIGESCGCCEEKQIYKRLNRDSWQVFKKTNSSDWDFNHITDELLCQTEYDKFYEVLSVYTYELRPFNHLWICINDDFKNPQKFVGEDLIRHGFTDRMNIVVEQNEVHRDRNTVSFEKSFDKKVMLPALNEDSDKSSSYLFLPLFFEDRCFGYVVLNHDNDVEIYSRKCRLWVRDAAQGIESFYRTKLLLELVDRIKADQIRDTLTGLYNYVGFYERFKALVEQNVGTGDSVAVVMFDLSNIKSINSEFGRAAGDEAIITLSRFISRSLKENEICGRLCNDEFLVGIINSNTKKRFEEIVGAIPEAGITCILPSGEDLQIFVHYAMQSESLRTAPNIDYLINSAVNAKNYKKRLRQQKIEEYSEMTQDEIKKLHIVENILDNNLLNYHFQPIVSADTGDIYGYEALMRYEADKSITPFEILRYAKKMDRLYDIERATFANVLQIVETNIDKFADRKVFINSLPAYHLKERDLTRTIRKLYSYRDQIVVEITEESEIPAESYELIYKRYQQTVQLALDDYGSGYSNANNILKYCPAYVKVDRSLISNIDTNSQKRYFVKSLIEYAADNGILVLAEGVETKEELRTVILLGVNLIQGYYTGKPKKEVLQSVDEEIVLQIKDFQRSRFQPRISE